MSKICLKNVSLSYPVFGVNTRSMTRNLLHLATGGILKQAQKGKAITVSALNNASFELSNGDRLGLVGHNGAGKSTLLKMLAGVYKPNAGSLLISGRISAMLDLNLGFRPELSGYENIRIRCALQGMNRTVSQTIIEDVENFSDLGSYLHLPVKSYSSGMSVRLAFAMSTAIHPDILLIDEVFGAGDKDFRKKAEARMESIIASSNIVVFASHDNKTVSEICNKALWLEHGTIKAFGPCQEVLESYENNKSTLPIL